MFVNQSDPKYQPKKRTIVNDEGKTVTVYTLDPSIFELSHIRFDEAHANYRRWFPEIAPQDAVGELEAYDNHRQKCRDINLVDERDFLMGVRGKPGTVLRKQVATQMAELEKYSQRQHREPHADRQGPKSTYPERTPSSYPD
ncbi:hypothetical protein B0H14DRAFT_3492585 [Mycena olivaceomarginata]|nr:hypothetical protein B0H14DRAFT_3492585 [Mycena olivaceomarginata]